MRLVESEITMRHVTTPNGTTTVEVVEQWDNADIFERCTEQNRESHSGDAEDSFFICDLGDVVQKHRRWRKNFPQIHPFYAIKCNPSEPVLKCMIAAGIGFDCASKAEIRQMLALGAEPHKIIFANPCKQSSHIQYAKDHGIRTMVFDNEIELLKIKKIYPDAKLLLRIQTDDSASICRFSMKYGAHADSCQMLMDTARDLDLNVIGVSFHVGSGCQDPTAFVTALQLARTVFDYATTIGYNLELLDIGGGFPGIDNQELSFEKIAAIVNEALGKLFPSHLFENLKIIAEPGRFYAASAFTLLSNVIAKRKVNRGQRITEKETPDAEKTWKSNEPAFMYFLNDGLYGSFNCLFYDHATVSPTLLKSHPKNSSEYDSSIWGPTCDGLDRIMENCPLPELEIGDWIIWKDMGAYTVAAGSAFNGFKTSVIKYFISRESLNLLESLCQGKNVPGLLFKCPMDYARGKLPAGTGMGKFDNNTAVPDKKFRKGSEEFCG